ncbi:hypothetical protein NDU88_007173 [Pleurodeles waltl]|uniref:Secreted protein n=1 Tax=Pleurodeles waltl TaxID=8319 RepID=A0AAV7VS14_PLEWA|nr:hypothetical protein NDU88_007173 [Pleurodeles waltl]
MKKLNCLLAVCTAYASGDQRGRKRAGESWSGSMNQRGVRGPGAATGSSRSSSCSQLAVRCSSAPYRHQRFSAAPTKETGNHQRARQRAGESCGRTMNQPQVGSKGARSHDRLHPQLLPVAPQRRTVASVSQYNTKKLQ